MSHGKKDSAMVLCASANHAFAVATFMINMKKTNPGLVGEYVVFHNGFSRKDRRLIGGILPTRFIKYRFPIEDASRFDRGTIGNFSVMVFAKFECFRLLSEYRTVVYSDYDVVVLGDLSELLAPSESGFRAIVSKDGKLGDELHAGIVGYDLERKATSTALLVLKDNFPGYMDFYGECYRKAEQYAEYLKLPEQASIDMLLQDARIAPEAIDQDVYCSYPGKAAPGVDAKILHAWGQPKFWNGLPDQTWESNYGEWLGMGGSPSTPNGGKAAAIKFLKKCAKRVLRLSRVRRGMTDDRLVKRILRWYRLPSFITGINDEKREALRYLKDNGLTVFPYAFSRSRGGMDIRVERDGGTGLPYVFFKDRKLFFRHDFSDDRVKDYMKGLLVEQDERSPHRYFDEYPAIADGYSLLDIGAAEGNISLEHIDDFEHVYIFESDPSWVAALKETFRPFSEKVTIVGKFVSDRVADGTISLDSFFLDGGPERAYVKIDVEGCEPDVLRGMESFLARGGRRALSVCTYHRKDDEANVTRILEERGFSVTPSSGYMLYPWIDGEINIGPPYLRRGLVRAETRASL